MTFNAGNNDLFDEEYDEFDEVYGCTHVGGDDLIRCKDCEFAECPMRGGKKEVA
jgi:hypothetical protein